MYISYKLGFSVSFKMIVAILKERLINYARHTPAQIGFKEIQLELNVHEIFQSCAVPKAT